MTSSTRPTVLVVDDDELVADTYAGVVRDRYETRVAYGGEAALDCVDGVDAVLLDRRMPNMSGDEVLDRIRSRGHDCVVVMTTAVDPDLNILEMDFDDYLRKPIDRTTLLETLETHLTAAARREPRLDEYFSIVSKLSVLEAEQNSRALATHEEYQRLQDRADELGARLEADLSDFETLVATHRDLNRTG